MKQNRKRRDESKVSVSSYCTLFQSPKCSFEAISLSLVHCKDSRKRIDTRSMQRVSFPLDSVTFHPRSSDDGWRDLFLSNWTIEGSDANGMECFNGSFLSFTPPPISNQPSAASALCWTSSKPRSTMWCKRPSSSSRTSSASTQTSEFPPVATPSCCFAPLVP